MPTGLSVNQYYATFGAPTPHTVNTTTSGSTSSVLSETTSQSNRKDVSVMKTLTDDGAGGAIGGLALINYGAKTVALKVIVDVEETSYNSNYERAAEFEAMNGTAASGVGYPDGPPQSDVASGGGGSSTARGGQYGTSSFKETFSTAGLIVKYKTSPVSPLTANETFEPPGVVIDLCPYTKDRIVPGSVRFTWMGTVYDDFEGKMYRGRTTNDPGIESGIIDYSTGQAHMTDYVVSGSPTSFSLQSLWTRKGRWKTANVSFCTQLSPVKPTGLVFSVLDIAGDQIVATANLDGEVTGDHATGIIDYETGLVEMQFGDYVLDSSLTAAQKLEWWYDTDDIREDGKIWKPHPVDPETLRYNVVAYFYLPLDAEILGLDPVRLPQDGRVPIFRPGSFAVVGHTGTLAPATYSNGNSFDCGRERLSRVRLIGNNGNVINTGYTVDLDTGIGSITDVTGWSQPVTVEHRIEDMAMVAEVQIDGKMSFTRQISHDYPVPGSYVSSALITGDLRARVSVVFDQSTWNNTWSDVQSGSAATGTFNNTANPIEVTNRGALTERWAVVFTNSTSFQVIGEHVGVIAIGNTSTDCEPINPASGTPYFSIPSAGWGLGWSTGNVMRFNTVGAYFPVWVLQTIQQGEATVTNDSFVVLVRGSVDNPI